MMTREEIRELAAFQADESKGASALSFYFQPDPPQTARIAARPLSPRTWSSRCSGKVPWRREKTDRCMPTSIEFWNLQPTCAARLEAGQCSLARPRMFGRITNCRHILVQRAFIFSRVFNSSLSRVCSEHSPRSVLL